MKKLLFLLLFCAVGKPAVAQVIKKQLSPLTPFQKNMKKIPFLIACLLCLTNVAFAQLTFTKTEGSYYTFTPTPSNANFYMKGQKTMIRGNIIATRKVLRGNSNTYAHLYTNEAGHKFLMVTETVYDDKYLLETNKWYFYTPDIDFTTTKWENGNFIIRMKPSKTCVNIMTSDLSSDESFYSLNLCFIELSKFSAEDFLEYIKK